MLIRISHNKISAIILYHLQRRFILTQIFFVFIHALNILTTRTTYCRHIGHSANCLPQFTQDAMCPHSKRTQSSGASMHTLHNISVGVFSNMSEIKSKFSDFKGNNRKSAHEQKLLCSTSHTLENDIPTLMLRKFIALQNLLFN